MSQKKILNGVEELIRVFLAGTLSFTLSILIKLLILPPLDIISNFKENCNNFSFILVFGIIYLVSVLSEEVELHEEALSIWVGLFITMATLYA